MFGTRVRRHLSPSQAKAFFACLVALVLICSGCDNPFAPREGGIADDLWTDQTTVGGLMENFKTAYMLRDSLRYADLIADGFIFRYFSEDLGRIDQWYRDTELRTTGALMRNVDNLDLRWGPLPEGLSTIAVPDTTVEFSVVFTLSAGEMAAISGFATFQAHKEEDGRFRITLWRDDY